MITCEHLQSIEQSARDAGLEIEAQGDWWGKGTKQNVYFSCILNQSVLKTAYNLPEFVEWYEWDGRVAGHEAGFHCKQCDSLLVGKLPQYGKLIWPT